jgi:branched-chain amino acid transport system permease protein
VQGSLKWVDNFGIQILIYVMLAWGLNIVVGLAGLLDLGYVAFYAVGAYSYALLSQQFGLSFWILLPLAGILRPSGASSSASRCCACGRLSRHRDAGLRRDHPSRADQLDEVTNGTFGISGIPRLRSSASGPSTSAAPNNFAKAFGLPMSSAYYKIFLFYSSWRWRC